MRYRLKCPKCGTELSKITAYCPECGEKLPEPEIPYATPVETVCPHCGEVTVGRVAVCPKCGQDTAAPPRTIPVAAPTAYVPPASSKNASGAKFAVASFILGLIGFVSYFLCGIGIFVGGLAGGLALIFGILGIRSDKRAMSIAGLVTGAVSICLWLLTILLLFIIPYFFDNQTTSDLFDAEKIPYFEDALLILFK